MIRNLVRICAPLPAKFNQLTAVGVATKVCCHHLPPAAVVVRWSSSGGPGSHAQNIAQQTQQAQGGDQQSLPNQTYPQSQQLQPYQPQVYQQQAYQQQQQVYQQQGPQSPQSGSPPQQMVTYGQHLPHGNLGACQHQQCAGNAINTGVATVNAGAVDAVAVTAVGVPNQMPPSPSPPMAHPKGSYQMQPQQNHDNTMRTQAQPSRMPEFYNPSTDFSRIGQSGASQQQQQRQFAVSKTYRSLTMPLKSSRLANPFPEPVKQMPSCQVSDQEKAQRMYNDSRLPGIRH